MSTILILLVVVALILAIVSFFDSHAPWLNIAVLLIAIWAVINVLT